MRIDVRTITDLRKCIVTSQDRVVIHFKNAPPVRVRCTWDGLRLERCDDQGRRLPAKR